MALNEKYSYKSWKRKSFTGKDPAEFNDSEIKGAGFSQNDPYTDVFPALMKRVIFTDCNLDNCNIPNGNFVNRGTHKHYKIQADGEYWIVDGNLNPVVPLKPYRFDKVGLSKDPVSLATIPSAEIRQGMPITIYTEWLKDRALQELREDTDKLIQILIDEGKL